MIGQQVSVESGIVPRFQWNANSGYCGETSFICAGLKFGQYCSQWTARGLASDLPQYASASQLLLGTGHAERAAVKMGLLATPFPGVRSLELILWVKQQLFQGNVPIIGVLNNVTALDETGPGDPQYDHIVPVMGLESEFPIDDGGVHYYDSDVITISDNGLYGPDANGDYPLQFSYEVGSFQGDRAQANEPGGPVYTLNNTPPAGQPCTYGIAIEGVLDEDNVCLPVSLACDRHREPDPPTMAQTPTPPPELAQTPLCDGAPTPIPIRLTATVDLSGQTGPCNLYRYDDFSMVPVSGFNATSANAVQVWNIPAGWGPTFAVDHDGMSGDTVVFRAVPASAP